ncbi:MAG: M28 family peptidase [Coriobacteriia bacterium]|nr:M28 family peptidase [Coriobacteriia bacterium]
MAETMQHLSALADEIGPRPATSDAESRAASYIESVFVARGLEPEIQEFDAPRTYSWAFVIYHLLSIAAAVCAGTWLLDGKLVWPMVAVSALVAFVLWFDLDTRWGLSRIMPKGPSQNVIARHLPKQRRGEKLKRIVIVAHYDSARSSLAFSPGMVGQFPLTFGLMKASTFAIPVVLLVSALPLPGPTAIHTYLWWLALAFGAYLLIPLFINVQREIGMPFVDGANDNASGVTAMLGVLHNLVSEPDPNRFATSQFNPIRRGPEAAAEMGVVPEGSLLNYTPVGGRDAATELPEDFEWVDPEKQADREPSGGQGSFLEFGTIEFGAVGEGSRESRDRLAERSGERPSERPVERPRERATRAETPARSVERDRTPVPERTPAPGPDRPFERMRRERSDHDEFAAALSGDEEPLPGESGSESAAPSIEAGEPAARPKRKGGLLGGLGRRAKKEDDAGVKDWLGVDDGFDARKAGSEIGSWDNFGNDDDDDGIGWKGGWAGDDPIGDDEFAANEAARIRRRVTESNDRELTEKEVWFVATGAEEVGTAGMEAFLAAYGDDIGDALIINIDNVGAGQLSWVTSEGMARRYRANQRLIGLAKRVSREQEILVKPRAYHGLSTDATAALARGFKAMTLMGFDHNGVPVNWHWASDTSANIEPEMIERVTELVTGMIRQA